MVDLVRKGVTVAAAVEIEDKVSRYMLAMEQRYAEEDAAMAEAAWASNGTAAGDT
jgi:hypothetical protein